MKWKIKEIAKKERRRGRRVWIREDADRRKMMEMG